MKWASVALLGITVCFSLFAAYQIYVFQRQRASAARELDELYARFQAAQLEHSMLKSDLEYYGRDENLEKELRARFHYKRPEEKMIIIVPRSTTTRP